MDMWIRTTPSKERYEAWKAYKDLVDEEVKRLEQLHTEAIAKHSLLQERIRQALNDMYHTQYELSKNMI